MVAAALLLAGVVSGQEPVQKPPYTAAWSVSIPAAPMYAPLLHNGQVLVAYLPGIVAAYGGDGKERWRVELPPEQPLAAYGELAFVASGEAVHALRVSDGSVQWRAPTGTVSAPLLAVDGWLIAAAGSRLSAFRASDGQLMWTREGPPMIDGATAEANTLFVPAADFTLRAHDLLTGAVKWEYPVGGAPGEPFALGGLVYFGAADKTFYCVDAERGEKKWAYRVGATVRSRASSDGTRVFFVGLDNLVRALDRRSGHLKWHRGVPFRPSSGPLVAGDHIFIGGASPDVHILRVWDGAAAGVLTLPNLLTAAPSVAASPAGPQIAAITGDLDETWKLTLATTTKPDTVAPPK